MVEQYDATIFSSPAFTRQLPVPQYLFYPSIDPLSEKNRDLPEELHQQSLRRLWHRPLPPVITQISRFDRLKDPVGVIEAYKLVKKYVDCQLVLAGGGATDDPEGAVVLQEVMEAAGDDPDVIILNLPPWSALEINALQRASTVIVQKSLKEGFGLTVTEGAVERKTRGRGRRGRHPDADHPQAYRASWCIRLRAAPTRFATCSRIPNLPSNWAKTAANMPRKTS